MARSVGCLFAVFVYIFGFTRILSHAATTTDTTSTNQWRRQATAGVSEKLLTLGRHDNGGGF